MTQSPSVTIARKILLDRRAVLARVRPAHDADVIQLATERRPEELAQNNEIADVLQQLSQRESDELREVDAALKRIELGTWGQCEKCHAVIPSSRLAALPEARTCTTCTP